jgi:hypothetical protein
LILVCTVQPQPFERTRRFMETHPSEVDRRLVEEEALDWKCSFNQQRFNRNAAEAERAAKGGFSTRGYTHTSCTQTRRQRSPSRSGFSSRISRDVSFRRESLIAVCTPAVSGLWMRSYLLGLRLSGAVG